MTDQTEDQILRQIQRLTALNQISLDLSSTLDSEDIPDIALEKIDLLLHYPISSLRVFDKESEMFSPLACRNLREEAWKSRQVELGEEITQRLIVNKTPIAVVNLQNDAKISEPEFFRDEGLTSCLVVPLIAKGELQGNLCLYTKDPHDFSDDEIECFSALASQIALAIYNSPSPTRSEIGRRDRLEGEGSDVIRLASYQIRSRLTSLMGYTGMLRDRILGDVNPRQKRALDKVMTNAYELLTLSEQLEASKIEILNREVLDGSRSLSDAVNEFEKEAILKALVKTGYNQTKAASLLGTTRSILRYRMAKLKINADTTAKESNPKAEN